jgi:hypothetical protein
MEPLSPADLRELEALETALWRPETRFDLAFMDRVLAPDFFEFGRSGRAYSRELTLGAPPGPIDIHLPLIAFTARRLDDAVVQVTYISEVVYDGVLERGRRSSIWSRTAGGWVLRFHQGTAIPDDTPN